MKITHNKIGTNLNLKDTGRADQADKLNAKGGEVKSMDVNPANVDATKVEVSSRAKEMVRAKELAMAAPDIDEEKVARLQKLIDSGQYKVDAKELADKMVDEHLSWS